MYDLEYLKGKDKELTNTTKLFGRRCWLSKFFFKQKVVVGLSWNLVNLKVEGFLFWFGLRFFFFFFAFVFFNLLLLLLCFCFCFVIRLIVPFLLEYFSTSVTGAQLIINHWVRYSHNIQPMKNPNTNLIQRGIQTISHGVMISQCILDNLQHGEPVWHPANVSCVLISSA